MPLAAIRSAQCKVKVRVTMFSACYVGVCWRHWRAHQQVFPHFSNFTANQHILLLLLLCDLSSIIDQAVYELFFFFFLCCSFCNKPASLY